MLWLVKSLQAATDAGDSDWKHLALTSLSAWQREYLSFKSIVAGVGRIRTVAWSPDGKAILTGSADGTVQLWEPVSGKPIGKPLELGLSVETSALSPDGKTILTGSADGMVRLWEHRYRAARR